MRTRPPVAVMALVLLTADAGATLVVPLDLPALTDRSEQIAICRVEAQNARITRDGGAVYTEVTLRVLQALKGDLKTGQALAARTEGGVTPELGMRVVGAARFSEGEEVLVFLERRGTTLWPVGMTQGRMPIAVIEGRRFVVRETGGLGFVRPLPTGPLVRPLDEVLREITGRVGSRR